jgi:glycosyltransferase involved in cell wall biosynthesis
MIESMSCGTPVIAWPHGAVPEIVEHGVTGFVVKTVDEAVSAVQHIGRLNRADVRARFEERFAAARMARDYLAVYRALGRQRAVRAI